MPSHLNLAEGNIHVINNEDHADMTAMEAASPGVSDIGKVHMVSESDFKSFFGIISNSNPRIVKFRTEIYTTTETTDATATTAYAITLNDEETYIIEARVMAQVAGDASNQIVIGKRFVYYRTSGGNATSLGSDDLFSHDSGGSWSGLTLTASVSTSTVNLQVTGIAATTIEWKLFVEIRKSF